jgi:hypothetical protein
MIDYQELIKILGNYCFWGSLRGAKFISLRLVFRVGGQKNIEK